jgi:hypothetical protein
VVDFVIKASQQHRPPLQPVGGGLGYTRRKSLGVENIQEISVIGEDTEAFPAHQKVTEFHA